MKKARIFDWEWHNYFSGEAGAFDATIKLQKEFPGNDYTASFEWVKFERTDETGTYRVVETHESQAVFAADSTEDAIRKLNELSSERVWKMQETMQLETE